MSVMPIGAQNGPLDINNNKALPHKLLVTDDDKTQHKGDSNDDKYLSEIDNETENISIINGDEWMEGLGIVGVVEETTPEDDESLKQAAIIQNVARALLLRNRVSNLHLEEAIGGEKGISKANNASPSFTNAYASRTARRRSTAAVELPKSLLLNATQRAEVVHRYSLLERKQSSLIPAVPSFSSVLEHTRGHHKALIRKRSETMRRATSSSMDSDFNSPLNLQRRSTMENFNDADVSEALEDMRRNSTTTGDRGGASSALAESIRRYSNQYGGERQSTGGGTFNDIKDARGNRLRSGSKVLQMPINPPTWLKASSRRNSHARSNINSSIDDPRDWASDDDESAGTGDSMLDDSTDDSDSY